MVLLMFFEALYFGHFLSFYTMQLEPPKSMGICIAAPSTKLITLPHSGAARGLLAPSGTYRGQSGKGTRCTVSRSSSLLNPRLSPTGPQSGVTKTTFAQSSTTLAKHL